MNLVCQNIALVVRWTSPFTRRQSRAYFQKKKKKKKKKKRKKKKKKKKRCRFSVVIQLEGFHYCYII